MVTGIIARRKCNNLLLISKDNLKKCKFSESIALLIAQNDEYTLHVINVTIAFPRKRYSEPISSQDKDNPLVKLSLSLLGHIMLFRGRLEMAAYN